MLYWSDEKSAKLFCDLQMSIAAYAEKHCGSFAVFSNYSGQTPNMRALEEMDAAAAALDESFDSVKGQRGEYLHDMLRGAKTFLALLHGKEIGYRDEVQSILGITLREIAPARAERLRETIGAELEREGYRQGSVAERVKQWYADNRLAPEQLVSTAQEYLALLQRETRKLVELPPEERWGVLDTTRGVVWAALSQYQGHYVTNVTMNGESEWKRPNFIDTISHELYPGHHCWYSRREQLFRAGQFPLEASVDAVCMADNAIFEGIPESGIHFLGIDDPQTITAGIDAAFKQRIITAKHIIDYVRILQMNACYQYRVEGRSKEEVTAGMTRDGWIEPAVAERVFRYFAHPFNGLYYPAYYYGRWIVTYAYDRISAEQRPAFFRFIYDEPHSTATFIRKVEGMTGAAFDPVAMAQK